MASNLKYSTVLKNAQQAAITTTLGANALLEIYSGAQPASPDTAIGAQVLLATLTCNAVFAPAPAAGVLTLNAITGGTGTAGAGAGTNAAWYRLKTSGGTAHIDGTVGTGAFDLNLNNVNIATGQAVTVASATYTNAQ